MIRASTLLLAVVLALVPAIGSVRAREAAAPKPVFEQTACPMPIPRAQDPSRVRCGFVTVPEDRTSPANSRTIRLAVAVLEATDPSPAPDPAVYLSGGPGFPSLSRDMQSFYAGKRTLVFFDQRGTGLSQPALTCPEVTADPTLLYAESSARMDAALLQCHDRLVAEGVHLSAYNSAASAADADDLMTALGYSEWNIYGVSYGTRLALTIMRDRPQHVRSVVLDSTLPVQVDARAEAPRNLQHSLDRLFADCAADPGCHAAYPGLADEFWALVNRANQQPLVVNVTGRDGKPLEFAVSGDTLLMGLVEAFKRTDLIPSLPLALDQVAHGNLGVLQVLAQQIVSDVGGLAYGMAQSVNCNEEIPFLTPDLVQQANAGVRPEIVHALGAHVPALLGLCMKWGTPRPSPIENQPVASSIPTLVLAGEYDASTPPSWGQLAAETLSHSTFLEFPATGHGVLFGGGDCAGSIVIAFQDDPLRVPDSSCVGQIPPPRFVVAQPQPAPTPPAAGNPAPISLPNTGLGAPAGGGKSANTVRLALWLLASGLGLLACSLRLERRRAGRR